MWCTVLYVGRVAPRCHLTSFTAELTSILQLFCCRIWYCRAPIWRELNAEKVKIGVRSGEGDGWGGGGGTYHKPSKLMLPWRGAPSVNE